MTGNQGSGEWGNGGLGISDQGISDQGGNEWGNGVQAPGDLKNGSKRDIKIRMESGMPWNGRVRIAVEPAEKSDFTLHLRNPSWSQDTVVKVNGAILAGNEGGYSPVEQTASGYDPRKARWISIRREWSSGDVVELELDTSIRLLRANPRVKPLRGKLAVTRGPLVYCLESLDNPGVDLFQARPGTRIAGGGIRRRTLRGGSEAPGKNNERRPAHIHTLYAVGKPGRVADECVC